MKHPTRRRLAIIGLVPIFILTLLLILAFIPPAAAAPAATIAVTTLTTTYSNDGQCDLGEAINAANSDTGTFDCSSGFGSDVIELPPGFFTAIVSDSANTIYPAITSDVTIRGAGIDTTILDPATLTGRFFRQDGSSARLTIEQMTLQNAGGVTTGGAVNAANRPFTSNFVKYAGNSATNRGGAIFGFDSTVTVNDSIFENNTALLGGGIGQQGDLTIRNSEFNENNAEDGGAVEILGDIQLSYSALITATNFFSNTALDDGAAISLGLNKLTIVRSKFHNHQGNLMQFGGSVLGSVNIRQSAIYDNDTQMDYLIVSSRPITIEQSAIYENEGSVLNNIGGQQASFLRSTIANNSPSLSQPLIKGFGSPLYFNHVTIVNEQPTQNATLVTAVNTTILLHNTILSSESNLADLTADLSSNLISIGGNIIGVVSSALTPSNSDLIGNSQARVDPQLEPFRQTGPEFWHMTAAPLPGSPAIDRIGINNRNTLCLPPTPDQRGETGGEDYDLNLIIGCDSGAHERQEDERFGYFILPNETYHYGATLAKIETQQLTSPRSTEIVRHNENPFAAIIANSFFVYWNLTGAPSDFDRSVPLNNVNLTLCYTDWEVAQNSNVVEQNLTIWQEQNNNWVDLGRTSIDTNANCVTLDNIVSIEGNLVLANASTATAVDLAGMTSAAPSPLILLLTTTAILVGWTTLLVRRFQWRF